MAKIPKPGQRVRRHRRIGQTTSSKALYQWFVKPFLKEYTLPADASHWKEGLLAFFNVDRRPIVWARAKEAFKMPGQMWSSQSQPYKLVEGTGDRVVYRGAPLIVRRDLTAPDRNEIEFREQVFVLTEAQYNVIREKLEVIA